MKTRFVLSFLLALFLSACDSTYYHNPATGQRFYTGSLGGKKRIASVTLPDGFGIQGYDADMEKSFRDGALMVGVVGASIANTIATKATEDTAQAAIAANAKAKSDASNAALQKALAAEQTKRLGMELEAAAPAIVPTP